MKRKAEIESLRTEKKVKSAPLNVMDDTQAGAQAENRFSCCDFCMANGHKDRRHMDSPKPFLLIRIGLQARDMPWNDRNEKHVLG